MSDSTFDPPPIQAEAPGPPPAPGPEPSPKAAAWGWQVRAFLLRGWSEVRQVAMLTWAQLVRLARFLFTDWQIHSLRKQAQAAQATFGRLMYERQLGDAELRGQLDQLIERIRSFEAARAKTRLLETERLGLYLRLAEAWLDQPLAANLETEQQRAAHARSLLAEHEALRSRQRATLLPGDQKERLRVAAGMGTIALLFLLMLRGTWATAGSRRPTRGIDKNQPIERLQDMPSEEQPRTTPPPQSGPQTIQLQPAKQPEKPE